MCEGFSQEDDVALDAAALDEYGFLTIGIDEPDVIGCPNWTYTVGFLDSYDHPELVVAGAPVQAAHQLIHQLWHAIDDGQKFAVGDGSCTPFGDVTFGAVHEVQSDRGSFGRWQLLADHGYLQRPFAALQVFVPASWKVPVPDWIEVDLSDPVARLDRPRPNRAARRRRAR
jgi:hypothetical protein